MKKYILTQSGGNNYFEKYKKYKNAYLSLTQKKDNNYYQKYIKAKKEYINLTQKRSPNKLLRGGSDIDIDDIYKQMTVSGKIIGDPKHLSSESSKIFENTHNSSTYGELTTEGFKRILEGINTKDKIFFDIGSGMGKGVMYATVYHNFGKSYGIELAKERYDASVVIKNSLPEQYKNKITLINSSFLDNDVDLSSADVMWISSLCFPDEIMKELATKLNKELKNNTIIFTSKELNAPFIKLIDNFTTKMTWNNNSKVHKYIVTK